MNFPEIEHLAKAIDHLAVALGDRSAEALAREQKWNNKKDDAFPETNPGPVPVGQPAAPVSQPASQSKPEMPTVPTTSPESDTQPPAAKPQPLPTAAKTYQFNDLARAASGLMDAGKQQQLINLLQQFGVQALTQLAKDKYGVFATALRQLGAAI